MIISWKGGRRDADRKSDKRECISGRNAAIFQQRATGAGRDQHDGLQGNADKDTIGICADSKEEQLQIQIAGVLPDDVPRPLYAMIQACEE